MNYLLKINSDKDKGKKERKRAIAANGRCLHVRMEV
jgi:hypothetical protein